MLCKYVRCVEYMFMSHQARFVNTCCDLVSYQNGGKVIVFCNEIFAGPRARKAETIHYTLSPDDFYHESKPNTFPPLAPGQKPTSLAPGLEHAMSMQTLHTLAANIR